MEQHEERGVQSTTTRKAVRLRDRTYLHIYTQRSAADALRLKFYLVKFYACAELRGLEREREGLLAGDI